jgi:aspartyl-tRNA(Asn)/glutamyl-tRNA(Gln) amidotransferase subunit A
MSVAALAARLRAGELSPREAVAACLERIEAAADLNAFLDVRGEEALAEADALAKRSEQGPLHGVPVAVKDVIDVAGTPTTAASRILAGHVAAADATTVARLRQAGAVIVGKLNTHEFAFGATTTSPHYGPAHNPWRRDRICGGSSGGSGAAVAADLVPAALGTDTGGSIRIPASLCGVTGVRPTIGRVSNRGVVPVSWTFDTVGPLARTAADCALLLEAIAGHDPADAGTARRPVPRWSDDLDAGVAGLRIGVVAHLLEDGTVDPGVGGAVEAALAELAALGARAERVDAAFLRRAEVTQQLLMLPEASEAHLPWLRTRIDEYGPDVRARLVAGLLLPATAPVTGRRARRALAREAAPLFDRYDLLAAPTMPVTAPPIGGDTVRVGDRDLAYRLALIPFNSPWSCLGLPAVSIPCGLADGLPVGLALVGRPFDEAAAFRAAHAYQQVTDWHDRRPPPVV